MRPVLKGRVLPGSTIRWCERSSQDTRRPPGEPSLTWACRALLGWTSRSPATRGTSMDLILDRNTFQETSMSLNAGSTEPKDVQETPVATKGGLIGPRELGGTRVPFQKERIVKIPQGGGGKEMAIKVIQVNLHHAKGASAALSQRFATQGLDIALLQEPWVGRGAIRGLPTQVGKLVYDRSHARPRACILIAPQLCGFTVTEFTNRDLVTVALDYNTTGGRQKVFFASAYFPNPGEDCPPQEVARLVKHAKDEGIPLILGCDANAHHIIWGSTDTNERGKDLLEYLLKVDLQIENLGNEPTFTNRIREEVLDLTLTLNLNSLQLRGWHVSGEASLSDHRQIRFDVEVPVAKCLTYRVPKLTDWEGYSVSLMDQSVGETKQVMTVDSLERLSSSLGDAIVTAYELNCPLKTKRITRDVPWWNEKLSDMRKKLRRLYNTSKRSGSWPRFARAQTEYNNEIRKSKRRSWRQFCERLTSLPEAARLQKALQREGNNPLGSLVMGDGNHTRDMGETLKVLMETHFPGGRPMDLRTQWSQAIDRPPREVARARRLSGTIFRPEVVKWAVNSFGPFKSPGGDGIFPALIQKGLDVILDYLVILFRGSFALGYIPGSWRKARVVFLLKKGRDPTQPKSYRPICLTSFMLKAMEKIINRHVRDELLSRAPLNRNQHAFMMGKSTTTALSSLVNKIEDALECKEVLVGVFMDIQGAFDNVSYNSIEAALERRGTPPAIAYWIMSLLRSRVITATEDGYSATIAAQRGCPQGGVLSPLLWALVVDDLLEKADQRDISLQAFADDLVLTVRGKYKGTIKDLTQEAVNFVAEWCEDEGLEINPSKTEMVTFTRKRRLFISPPKVKGAEVKSCKETKYLGVFLDQRLTWNKHLDYVLAKGTGALGACRRTFGKKWGLSPKLIFWTYESIVKPMLTYAALVWWPKVEQSVAAKKLQQLQRLACAGVCGCTKSCPTIVMESMLGILPLGLEIKRRAVITAFKTLSRGMEIPQRIRGHLSILEVLPSLDMELTVPDTMVKMYDFDKPYQVRVGDSNDWQTVRHELGSNALVFYTDGSRIGEKSGLGVFGNRTRISIALGTTPTVFQSEVLAIEHCARVLLEKGLWRKKVLILSDSQAALKALDAWSVESKVVLSCRNALKAVARGNRLQLAWIPGHSGHEGNERADALAREGSESLFKGPEPYCSVPLCTGMDKIRKWVEVTKAHNWNNHPGIRQSKALIDPFRREWRGLINLPKRDISLLLGLLTGHGTLRKYLCKIGLAQSDSCRFCDNGVESAIHIWLECPALVNKRMMFLGRAELRPEEIKTLGIAQLTGYAKSLKLSETI